MCVNVSVCGRMGVEGGVGGGGVIKGSSQEVFYIEGFLNRWPPKMAANLEQKQSVFSYENCTMKRKTKYYCFLNGMFHLIELLLI